MKGCREPAAHIMHLCIELPWKKEIIRCQGGKTGLLSAQLQQFAVVLRLGTTDLEWQFPSIRPSATQCETTHSLEQCVTHNLSGTSNLKQLGRLDWMAPAEFYLSGHRVTVGGEAPKAIIFCCLCSLWIVHEPCGHQFALMMCCTGLSRIPPMPRLLPCHCD